MKKGNLFFYLLFVFPFSLYGQKTIASDSVLYHYKSGKDSIRVIVKESGKSQRIAYFEDGNIERISLHGRWMYKGSRIYYSDGKLKARSKCGIWTRRSKRWDEQGRIIAKSRTHPWYSTSHTTKEKKIHRDSITGQIVKIEKTKNNVACFGGRGYTKDILITFDASGKRIGRKNLLRKQKKVRDPG